MQTQELTTTSILSLFETTKVERQDFVIGVVEALDNGNVDPLKIHLQVKCMEDIITQLTSMDEKKNKGSIHFAKKYRDHLLTSVQAYGKKSFEFQNSKVEIKETGTKYDFSKCEDPILNGLYAKQAEFDLAVKAREAMLKTISEKGMIITDEESGETFTVYPPSKSSTTSVAITLK